MDSALVSLVLLHCDKESYSRACLLSLEASSHRPLQVINLDNGSRDGTPLLLEEWEQRARELGIEVLTLRFETNQGAVRGRNEALKHARGAFIGFLDNDILIARADWIQGLRAALEDQPRCGIVAPRLLFPWSPFLIECCGVAISANGRVAYLDRGARREDGASAREVGAAISASWLMRRAVYERIGPLDERYSPVQWEDLDYCFAARAAGFSVRTCPEVELYHFEHTTTAGTKDVNFRYVTARNALRFRERWGDQLRLESAIEPDATHWLDLPKKRIEEVDWRALVPPSN